MSLHICFTVTIRLYFLYILIPSPERCIYFPYNLHNLTDILHSGGHTAHSERIPCVGYVCAAALLTALFSMLVAIATLRSAPLLPLVAFACAFFLLLSYIASSYKSNARATVATRTTNMAAYMFVWPY